MTQQITAISYQDAIQIVGRARTKAKGLQPVREKLSNVLAYLNKQAFGELAETLQPPKNESPAALKFLLIDKASGKAVNSFATLEEAKESGRELTFWEVWSDGTRMIVVGNGYTKEHAARG